MSSDDEYEAPLSPNTLYREQLGSMLDTYKSMQEDKETISFEEIREVIQLSNMIVPMENLMEVYSNSIGLDNNATREEFIAMLKDIMRSTQSTTPSREGTPSTRIKSSIDFQEKCL